MPKKILIIGAGYAGILAAKKLEKKLRKDEDIHITIVDKNSFHTMLTELHEVAANRVDEDSIKIGLKKIFARRKVDVVLDTVTSIDFAGKKVSGENKSYDYDYLILAAGSQPSFFGVTGAEQYSFKLWSYEDAVCLKEHIHQMFRKASCEPDLEKRKSLLRFFVVGAGFTGVEMVGELAEYVPILCEKYEIKRDLVEIINVDVLSRAVPILTEKLSAKVERRLQRMGVRMMLETGVVSIGEDYVELKKDEQPIRKSTQTVIWAAGIESADITLSASVTLKSCGRGRIEVDPYLRAVGYEDVFVVGDNMFCIPEGQEEPVPQMVENCEQSAATVALNLVSALTGKGEMKPYKPSFHGVMVSIGGRYGVARVGTSNFMISLPSFFAMFVKHFINIIYFIQVAGWNKIFSYLKHEFFTIRNRRSFVGGHFSNRTPSFLLVPLRIWLGSVWLFEGIKKISEGWLTTPMLKSFFGGATSWYDSIINAVSSGVSSVAEVSSAATEEVGEAVKSAGEVFFNFNIMGLFDAMFVSGKQLSESTLQDLAFRLNVPLMNWFVDSFVLSSDSMQIFMQVFIVVAEILIGLALIGGLFTTPASAFSLVLQVMFVCTTGLYLGTFWMIFAAIALLIASGRIFGLDYYAMPWLKALWRKIPFIRKWYLYND